MLSGFGARPLAARLRRPAGCSAIVPHRVRESAGAPGAIVFVWRGRMFEHTPRGASWVEAALATAAMAASTVGGSSAGMLMAGRGGGGGGLTAAALLSAVALGSAGCG